MTGAQNGTTIEIRYFPDGLVAAVGGGRVAIAPTEREALRRLSLLLAGQPGRY